MSHSSPPKVIINNPVPFLRQSGIAEGISWLVLLFFAMPLKHIWEMPLAVKIVGWIHGVLFVAFCVALIKTYAFAKWPTMRVVVVFIAALLPFGTFAIDRRMKEWSKRYPEFG